MRLHPQRTLIFLRFPTSSYHPRSMARFIGLTLFWLRLNAVCCPFPYLLDYHFDDKRQVNVKCERVSVQGDRQNINVYQFITNMFLNCNFINKYCSLRRYMLITHDMWLWVGGGMSWCGKMLPCFIFLRGNKWKLCTNITWIIIVVVNLILPLNEQNRRQQ